MGNNNMKREHQLLFTMADPRDAPQHPQITTTTAKKRNEYDARSMFSRHPQRGYQGTRSMPEADFSFLKKFASTEDIDAFIQRLVTERKKGTLILNDGDISSAKESSLSFANESVFASPVLLEPTLSDLLSWTNRDEAAFVRALRERGAYKAAVDYVLGGSAIAHHPSVYLYTATLTTLAVWRQQRDFNNDHRNHHREMCWTVLDEMDRHQIPPTPYTLTALFQAYCFSPFDAVTLRRELVYRYPNNTHALWTEPVWEAAINACAAAAGGVATTANPTDVNATWEAAEGLYRDLLDQLLLSTKTEGDHISSCLGTASIKSGKVPSARMLIAVFHVCAVTKNVDKAISFLDTLLSRDSYGNSTRPFRMTPRLWAAVLKVCALAGDHEQARTILERMSTEGLCPNVRHCTAYLKAMVVDKKAQVAASFLEHMAEVGFGTRTNSDDTLLFPRIQVPSPDMIAVKTCLVGCASIGNFTLARRILTQVKNGFYGEKVQHELDEQCYNIALSACNDPESAKELVREMRLTRRYRVGVIPPSKATFTRAITVCRKARNVESARFFLSGARNDGVDPDAFMYSAGA